MGKVFLISVSDPSHFDMDPDPGIHISFGKRGSESTLDPDPDPLFPNVDPRIRIHYYGKVDPRIRIHFSQMWIPGSGSGSMSK